MVTLENRTGRQLIFHLAHAHACGDHCHCIRRVVGMQVRNPLTGAKELRAHKHRVPSSITLNAKRTEGSKISGLPDGIIGVPEIAKAIRAKQIVFSMDPKGTIPHHQAGKIGHQQRLIEAAKKAAAAEKPPAKDPGPKEGGGKDPADETKGAGEGTKAPDPETNQAPAETPTPPAEPAAAEKKAEA